MKKNLLFVFMALVCCLFSVQSYGQCDVDVSWVGVNELGGYTLANSPFIDCNGGDLSIGVATGSEGDAEYELSANFGTFGNPSVQPGFVAFYLINDNDIEDINAAGGTIEITFTGLSDPTCTGTISATLAELGIDEINVYEYCCTNPSWIDAAGPFSSFVPTPYCEEGFIVLPLIAFGIDATTFTVTSDAGVFNSTGENTTLITFDGESSNIEVLLFDEEQLTAIDGGVVTITFVNDGDPGCPQQSLVYDFEGQNDFFTLCEALSPLAYDACESAVLLSEGENGPFSNLNATTDENEPTAQAGCFFDDDVYQTTVWFTFFGSGDDVTITSNNSCAGLESPNTDTQFAIYEGSCNGPQIACNDDIDAGATNFLSTLTIATDNGQLYYLLVDGWNGTSGDFCLEVSGSGAPCEVTAPAISSNDTNICPDEDLIINLDAEGSGAAGTRYVLTNIAGTIDEYQILAGPQESNTFSNAGLPEGNILGWAVSVEDAISDTDGTVGGLQGCFEFSDPPILFKILPAADEDCFVSTITIDNVQDLQLFPQPATDNVNLVLTTNTTDAMNLQVVDLAGKVISSSNIDVQAGQNTINLDVSNFASGMYFVQLSNDEGIATTKLIKQ